MKLLSQSHSPYARKVVVVAHELGCDDIEIEHQETSPTNPNPVVSAANPLGKVPVLLTDNGAIYDSGVICAYLCHLKSDSRILPSAFDARIRALRLQALADDLCATGIAARWETERRPENLRYPLLRDGLLDKLAASFAYLEDHTPSEDDVTVGTIALACALDWLAFRGMAVDPARHPKLSVWLNQFIDRPSMRASQFEGETVD
ncbi:MAG: glutathione S-transferase N-terminal domain-containing protein [Pseudomonadota bacterium]